MNSVINFSTRILLLLLILLPGELMAGKHSIKNVERVSVECPVGNAPRLPWQVWVTYADGTAEWRQVRWTNDALAIEQMEADARLTPAGTTYKVRGYVTGDNATAMGYPIDADVRVTEKAWAVPDSRPQAQPLPLGDVMLRGENLLTANRRLDVKMLLSLDVTQQLYNYRDTYGLPTEGYRESDGWDSPTTKLKGHGTGHYLSALALAFAGTQDEEERAQLRSCMRRMVDEMRECQERTFVFDDSLGRYREARDLAPEQELLALKGTWSAFNEYKKDWTHYGYGYLNAIPPQHALLIEAYRPYNNEEWVWAPYYTIHKQLAGLIDIATNVDDKEIADKALLIARDMGLWVWNRLHYRTYSLAEGNAEQRRARPGNRLEMWNMYIAGEVGGMAESLARLSVMADDAEDSRRLAEAATYFDAPAFFNPVIRNIDNVRTRHANQHIPMITGALREYATTGRAEYYNLARNFWEMIMGRYVYAMGGVGNGEMWRQPYSQMVSMNTNSMTDRQGHRVPNPNLNETCCAYNLAKLTKDLNCYTPDDARLMDYYERVLYNQIVGSLHPQQYGVTYQYAVGLNASKPYGNVTPQESCCGGTGAENHVKYQEAAYFVGDETLWVGLYLPTTALWREKGVRLEQECEWPAERTRITVRMPQDGTQCSFNMKLRVPYWATKGFEVLLNGKRIAAHCPPCSYVETGMREWRDGDVVEVLMPFVRHIDYGPDRTDLWLGTLMYGPLVMTSPDIHTWEEATMALDPTLADVKAGKDADGFWMQAGGKSFVADYAATGATTHYLRLSMPRGRGQRKETIDTLQMSQLIMVAQDRLDNQQTTPWARHGLERMKGSLKEAQRLMDIVRKGKKSAMKGIADELTRATAQLNAAIVSMRPGNLAEPEDLMELTALIERVSKMQQTPERLEALRYARMVVRYVNDGSGTMDMIEKAITKLK